jgi:hypothetical protein
MGSAMDSTAGAGSIPHAPELLPLRLFAAVGLAADSRVPAAVAGNGSF